jgi:clathrin heavy chain
MFNNMELALSRAKFLGAENPYVKQYQQLFRRGQYGEAAKVAANSPGVCDRHPRNFIVLLTRSLRNFTDRRCDRIVQTATNSSRDLSAVRYHLAEGEVDHLDSLELAHPVVQLGRKQLLEK